MQQRKHYCAAALYATFLAFVCVLNYFFICSSKEAQQWQHNSTKVVLNNTVYFTVQRSLRMQHYLKKWKFK